MKAKLETVSDDLKESVCHFPLSQPYFFVVVLIIWSTECWKEIRTAFLLLKNLMCLETIGTMRDALPEDVDLTSCQSMDVTGLTVLLKVLFALISLSGWAWRCSFSGLAA